MGACSFIAQMVKIIAKLFKTGRLDLRMFARTGGMPSSHSCSAAGMATSVGFLAGFDSIPFAIAFCLAIIVMYDAAGVRRNVGLQGRVLNSMVEELFSEHPHLSSEKVRELLGHSPFEVMVGAALGASIAWLIHILYIF
jgi:acid phosphatase family membrane protein YuiD